MEKQTTKQQLEYKKTQDEIAKMIGDYYYDSVKQIAREVQGVELTHQQAVELAQRIFEEDLKRGIDPFWKGWGVYTKENTKYDEQGRVIWHIYGDTITENIYSDSPDEYPIATKYNITYKEVQDERPDLLEWAKSVRRLQSESVGNKGKPKRSKKNSDVYIPAKTREDRQREFNLGFAMLKHEERIQLIEYMIVKELPPEQRQEINDAEIRQQAETIVARLEATNSHMKKNETAQ